MDEDDNFESLSTEEKLKLTMYQQVSKSLDEIGQSNQLLGESTFETQPKELLAEFMWKKLISYAHDMEAFALHAKRSTINVEDIKLLFRKNPQLLEKIASVEEEMKAAEEAKPERASKRKRPAKDQQPVVEVPDEDSNL